MRSCIEPLAAGMARLRHRAAGPVICGEDGCED
jgi:hypothetical protein